MSSSTIPAESDAEDVNDFLRRIQELSNKRDQEDEERNRKLEEEILQGRKERQARRAERARSISPSKASPSPLNTPQSYHSSFARSNARDSFVDSPKADISQISDQRPPSRNSTREQTIDDAMERLTGARSPTRESTPNKTVEPDTVDLSPRRIGSVRASPSNAMPSRTPTLSWQQRRPTSQASDRPRSRPLSMIASENAARSPRATPEPSSSAIEPPQLTREQIAQSLASKDPTWFRQTPDRGHNSPAYRKNQVEDNDVMEHGQSASRVSLPGMSGDISTPSRRAHGDTVSVDSRTSSTDVSTNRVSNSSTSFTSRGLGSPLPQSSAERFEPPNSDTSSILAAETRNSSRQLAMSPSQGRISPDRMDRPSSPTKGLGGFVQSAMMKRSDSVNKRWSVTSPPGLSRGNSIASHRGTHEPSGSMKLGGVTSPSSRQSGMSNVSREGSPRPQSRPTSSHSNATVTQGLETTGTSNSSRPTSVVADGAFIKPSMPASRSQGSIRSNGLDREDKSEVEATPPSSPSKASGRWSPTKSSWLESALNKPESPKPKAATPSQQPSWMTEISKAKQKNMEDTAESPGSVHKHQVSIDGLLKSSPMGGVAKPHSIGGLPTGFTSGVVTTSRNQSIHSLSYSADKSKATPENAKPTPAPKSPPSTATKPSALTATAKDKAPAVKAKPETPPKKDFRANLKPRQIPQDSNKSAEPEFKNVIGQLRRTKTQNYVAPDELKGNILRGKAELTATGGPVKSERKDEFKDAILKKKEDFKKAQAEGTGVTRTASGGSQAAPIPEALAKAAVLGRASTIATKPKAIDSNRADSVALKSSTSPIPSLAHESSAPGRLQTSDGSGSKLAARFNPNLAGILARGPPPSKDVSSSAPSADAAFGSQTESSMNDNETGPQLTHMTKARARGPRRKAPTSSGKTAIVSDLIEEPKAVATIVPETTQSMADPAPSVNSTSTKFTESKTTTTAFSKDTVRAETLPVSPSKLDIKRRSQFLDGSSPSDVLKTIQSPVAKQDPSSRNDAPVSTSTPPKPTSSTGSKPKLYGRAPSPKLLRKSDLETSSPTNAKANASAALLPSKHDSSNIAPKEASSYKKDFQEIAENSPSFIQNAAAMFGRSPVMPARELPVQESNNLPTKTDNATTMTMNADPRQRSPKSTEASVDARASLPSARRSPVELQNPTRALPNFPSKLSKDVPPSPRVPSASIRPAPTDTSKLLTDFFGIHDSKPEYKVDTASVLSSKTDDAAKIKTLRSQLFQLTDTGKKQPVQAHQERLLFEGNMYLCPHTYGTTAGKKITETYFWAGDDVPDSVFEDSHVFAQREAKNAGGGLVVIRQGKETAEFVQALGGIVIIRRGSSNKYDSLAPHILCGRRHQGQIVFDEVNFATTSLCSGFPYLIATQGKLFLWKGKGSSVDELSCARLIGMDFGLTGEIEEIEEGAETQEFLDLFGSNAKITKSADHWRLKPNYTKYSARLFLANGTTATSPQIVEIKPFTQRDISASSIYILDAFFEIYIIVGSASNTQYEAFCTALLFAQEYGILAAGMEDRPFVPVSTVVLEGVPRDLRFVFRKWSEELAPTVVHSPVTTLARGRSLRVVTLNAALDATQR